MLKPATAHSHPIGRNPRRKPKMGQNQSAREMRDSPPLGPRQPTDSPQRNASPLLFTPQTPGMPLSEARPDFALGGSQPMYSQQPPADYGVGPMAGWPVSPSLVPTLITCARETPRFFFPLSYPPSLKTTSNVAVSSRYCRDSRRQRGCRGRLVRQLDNAAGESQHVEPGWRALDLERILTRCRRSPPRP